MDSGLTGGMAEKCLGLKPPFSFLGSENVFSLAEFFFSLRGEKTSKSHFCSLELKREQGKNNAMQKKKKRFGSAVDLVAIRRALAVVWELWWLL